MPSIILIFKEESPRSKTEKVILFINPICAASTSTNKFSHILKSIDP